MGIKKPPGDGGFCSVEPSSDLGVPGVGLAGLLDELGPGLGCAGGAGGWFVHPAVNVLLNLLAVGIDLELSTGQAGHFLLHSVVVFFDVINIPFRAGGVNGLDQDSFN